MSDTITRKFLKATRKISGGKKTTVNSENANEENVFTPEDTSKLHGNDECSICLDELKVPRRLPCGHSFCHSCLDIFISELVRNADEGVPSVFNCPNCRAETIRKPQVPVTKWVESFPLLPVLPVRRHRYVTKLCHPCKSDELETYSSRYCRDCRIFLCELCFSSHKLKRLALSNRSSHNIVMANEVQSTEDEIPVEYCTCRWGEKLDCYCDLCKEFGCSKCYDENHIPCRRVADVGVLSSALLESAEVEKVLKKREVIAREFLQLATLASRNKDAVDAQRDKAIQAVKENHEFLKILIAEAETTIIEEINSLWKDVSDCLIDRTRKCKTAVSEIESCPSGTSLLRASKVPENDQLFIPYHRHRNYINKCEIILKGFRSESKTLELLYTPSEDLHMLLGVFQSFGQLETNITTGAYSPQELREQILAHRKAQRVLVYRFPMDVGSISSLVELANGRLIVVDQNKGKVFLLVKSTNNCMAMADIPGVWDIAVISTSQVAVTSRKNEIHFLSTTDLTCLNTWTDESNIQYWGITYSPKTREIIVTTRFPNTVEIMSLTSETVVKIEKAADGLHLLSNKASCVAVDDTGETIYVSDQHWGVVALNRRGEIKFMYTDLRYAHGIALDGDGNIFVCGKASNDIHQISPQGNQLQVIDDIPKPFGLYFNRMNDTLSISHDRQSYMHDEIAYFQFR